MGDAALLLPLGERLRSEEAPAATRRVECRADFPPLEACLFPPRRLVPTLDDVLTASCAEGFSNGRAMPSRRARSARSAEFSSSHAREPLFAPPRTPQGSRCAPCAARSGAVR